MKPVSYNFKAEKYSKDEAEAWMEKAGVDFMEMKEINAKLSMKAATSRPEVDGRIWSAGIHHVFVNEKPARVYVPEGTIEDTFKDLRRKINENGRLPLGIDHLSQHTLEENEILAKMNLLDVGDIYKVGTDGEGIYILDSAITNDTIKSLNSQGDLPAYSVVGAMDAKPCPDGKADYVVKKIDIERVDFVEQGGCQVCTVGAQPDELILTSKTSDKPDNLEENNMAENETVPKEEVEDKTDETNQEESVEEKNDENVVKVPKEEIENQESQEAQESQKEEEKDESQKEDPRDSEIQALRDEIKELKETIGGKKPKVEAKKADFDPEAEVNALIKAGKALPKMRDSLLEVAETSEEAFKSMAAKMPKFVEMEAKAKLAKIEEQTKPKKKEKKEYFDSDEFKKDLEAFGM